MAEMDKLRAENDRLTKEKTSKAGEISGMVIDSILLFCLLFTALISRVNGLTFLYRRDPKYAWLDRSSHDALIEDWCHT